MQVRSPIVWSVVSTARGHFGSTNEDERQLMQLCGIDEDLEIELGQKIELKPGAYRVMFTELREPLKERDTLRGELRFEKAGLVDIEYDVESVGAQAPHRHTSQPRTSTVTRDAQNR